MSIFDFLLYYYPFLNTKRRAKIMGKYLGSIGKNCSIFHKVSFGSEPYLIEIGENVKITYGCRFITHDGGVEVLRNLGLLKDAHIYGKIKIGNNVFIGNNVTILPGCVIGDNCVIGTGSIVTKSFTNGSVIAGVPARKLLNIEDYFNKLKDKSVYTSGMSTNQKKRFILEIEENKFLKK